MEDKNASETNKDGETRTLTGVCKSIPWIPEPSTVNNKLKRREGSGSTGRFFD